MTDTDPNPTPDGESAFAEMSRSEFLNLAALCEGGLFAAALLLAWVLRVKPQALLLPDTQAVGFGVVAAVPLLVIFGVLYRLKLAPLQRIRQLLTEMFAPLLARCSPLDVLLLAVMAGVCEELLFRGTIQLWLSQWGPVTAVVVCSLLFGLAHFVTLTYFLLATLIGAYLSWTLTWTERPNLLTPMIAHAVYDYVAFLVILRIYRRERSSDDQIPNPPADNEQRDEHPRE